MEKKAAAAPPPPPAPPAPMSGPAAAAARREAAARAAVEAAVETLLLRRKAIGSSVEARAVCAALVAAGFPEADWEMTLISMSDGDLTALVEAVRAEQAGAL